MSDSRQNESFDRRFKTEEDFIAYVRQIAEETKIPFLDGNGDETFINIGNACSSLAAISRFLSAPERIDCMALHDGRIFVARHNHTNLTQHLRWAAKLDQDSKPRRIDGKVVYAWNWPRTVLLWFWSNGGKTFPGENGEYSKWAHNLKPPIKEERERIFNIIDQEAPF